MVRHCAYFVCKHNVGKSKDSRCDDWVSFGSLWHYLWHFDQCHLLLTVFYVPFKRWHVTNSEPRKSVARSCNSKSSRSRNSLINESWIFRASTMQSVSKRFDFYNFLRVMHAIGSLVLFFLFLKSFFIIFLDLIAKRGYFYVSQWMKNIYI